VDRPQEKKQPHKKARIVFALIVISVVGFLVWGFYSTYVRYSPRPLTTTEEKLPFGEALVLAVEEEAFSLELLGEWRETDREESEDGEDGEKSLFIRWEPVDEVADEDSQANRFFELYSGGKVPEKRPLNRLLPVVAEGSGLQVEGEPSYNCFAFAPGIASGETAQVAWQNIVFICDIANPLKNIIGTGSELGDNKFEVEGEDSGKQTYFLVYSAGEASPTDSVLVHAVETFEAK
jgi:hypothetical protein